MNKVYLFSHYILTLHILFLQHLVAEDILPQNNGGNPKFQANPLPQNQQIEFGQQPQVDNGNNPEPPKILNNPPVINNDPPVINNDPPVINNDPPVINNDPPVINNDPPVINNDPPVNNPHEDISRNHLGDIQPGHKQNSLKNLQKSPFVSVKNQQPLEAQQQFVKNVPPPRKGSFKLLSDSLQCKADIQRVCPSNRYNLANNFDVLSCLSVELETSDMSPECHHYIWQYKLNITTNNKFHTVITNLCQDDLKQMLDCNSEKLDGAFVACMAHNKDKITGQNCLEFLRKIQIIIFNDFHFVGDFVQECKDDVIRLNCGSLNVVPQQSQNNGAYHSQENVLHCLQDHLAESGTISPKCLKQVIRLSEFSADDYHLDKQLYIKCKNDRETFCSDVPAGQGRVYKCLFDHKLDSKMSPACSSALTGRQKLIAKDYKASSTLVQHCHIDIATSGCDKVIDPNTGQSHVDETHVMHLSGVLLCLENSAVNGVPLSKQCEKELFDYREMLMNDHELIPEVTRDCADEIFQKCDRGLEKNGRTLHCLFNLASQAGGLSEKCNNALFNVIKETDVAGDYRMDSVLTEACQKVISIKCSTYKAGDPLVVSCLLENLNHRVMTKSCKKAVTDIQYFISRDFRIDPTFRNACEKDSQKFCFVPIPKPPLPNQVDLQQIESPTMPLSLVISCLYRHIHPEPGEVLPSGQLSVECEEKVHSLLKQRAVNVNLNPTLERKCRIDLGRFCSHNTHKSGSEFLCLQDNYENLEVGCHEVVKKLTQMQSENAMDFENILIKECEPMLKKYCGELLQHSDDGKVMACLVDKKEMMESEKCRAGITHFQLIEMKDYELNSRFTKACRRDIGIHCRKDVTSSAEVVKCLSEKIRNHKLSDGRSIPVSKKCVAEVTVEKLQMHRNIELNPELQNNCNMDVKNLCQHVKTGEAQVIECLRVNEAELTLQCRKHLFQFKEEESEDRSMDYQLMTRCKEDIKKHCFDDNDADDDDTVDDSDYILECLVENKHMLDKNCKVVVNKREKEIFSDISLNKDLQKSCDSDISTHCSREKMEAVEDHKEGKDPHGIIYECLKDMYADKNVKLTTSCHEHLEKVIREQQQNYKLDPQLTLKCVNSIERLCPPKEGFNVVECLKKEYFEGTLSDDKTCMLEIAKLLQEGLSDIMADPILQQACSHDLERHCSRVPEGKGRLINCLVHALDAGKSLSRQCHEQIQVRKDMWKKTMKDVNGFADLHNMVMESQHSSYIFSILFCIVVVVLILGVVCGRISKRAARYRRMI